MLTLELPPVDVREHMKFTGQNASPMKITTGTLPLGFGSPWACGVCSRVSDLLRAPILNGEFQNNGTAKTLPQFRGPSERPHAARPVWFTYGDS